MDKSDLARDFLKRNRRVFTVAALAAALAYVLHERQFGPVTRALGAVALVMYGSLLVRLARKTPFHWRRQARTAETWSLPPTEAELEQTAEQTRRAYGSLLRTSISGTRLLLAIAVAGAPAVWLLWNGNPVNFLPLWIIGWVIYEFSPIDRVRAKEIGLLFRRFSSSPDSDQFCVNVADATKGICSVITIQDQSYPGDGSIKRYAIAYILVLFALPQFFILMLLGAYGPTIAILTLIAEWVVLELYRSRDFAPVDTDMSTARIDAYVRRVQHGRWHDNGVHAIRFTDRAWQPAVLHTLSRAAVALISVDSRFMAANQTENENLLWEIDLALRTVLPSRVVFIWSTQGQEAFDSNPPSVSRFVGKLEELTRASAPKGVLRAHFVGFSPQDETQSPDLPRSEANLRLAVAAAVA